MSSPPTRPSEITLELSSNPRYLSGVRELISAVARRAGFTEMNCSQIALAVDEALCNVMRHGYAKRTDGRIWVHVDPREPAPSDPAIPPDQVPAEIRITIEDEARQVDPESIRGRDLEDIRPGGLGVHIIREVMDDARYEKRPGAGMRLTLLKRQGPGAKPTPGSAGRPTPGGCGCGDSPREDTR